MHPWASDFTQRHHANIPAGLWEVGMYLRVYSLQHCFLLYISSD
jgi:hypothetical protein